MVKQNTAIISNQINQNTNIIYNQFSYDEGCGDDNDNNFDEIIKFNSLTRCKDIIGVDLINDNAIHGIHVLIQNKWHIVINDYMQTLNYDNYLYF